MTREHPTVTLSGPAMVPLVRAAAALETSELPPFAVIGGVAVAVRLGRTVRATADLDAVTDYRSDPRALDILRARPESEIDPTDSHTVWIAGTQVQFQDVAAVTDDEIRDLDTKDLLYVAAHATALTTAGLVHIRASSAYENVEAEVPVATTGALVAMKLHAYVDRRGQAGPDKRSGDLWDIYNLLQFAMVDAAHDLSEGSILLRDAVCITLKQELIGQASRARTVLRTSRDERYQAITADELAHIATDLVNRLQP